MGFTDDQGRPELQPGAWFSTRSARLRPHRRRDPNPSPHTGDTGAATGPAAAQTDGPTRGGNR